MPTEREGHDTHGSEYATSASYTESEEEETRQSVSFNAGPPSAPYGYKLLQHQRTSTIHYIAEGAVKVMLCGRMVSEAHREPRASALRHDSAVCRCCKNAVG